MAAVGNALITLMFWYGAAIVFSLAGGIVALFSGSASGLPMLLFGGISLNSIGASIYLGRKNKGWKLLWALPAVVLPFGFVLFAEVIAGPTYGPGRVDLSTDSISSATSTFIGANVLVLAAMALGLRPHWSLIAAIATFCVTLSIVAWWLGNVAMTHTEM